MFVELCEEDKTQPGDEHGFGKLVKSICRTRAAAHDWQELGLKQGNSSPCVFWHWQRDIKAVVHGDDFV